ncbi:hypothetical protein M433DRAFT_139873 [Acidomyces richmondensis BFW]|nr:MAG: hypothetical protein FE78DRAFT_81368 [Acidomyces sp. 'richmondensis']KYG49708.1 hypothetical protein M433DRAFT_139873 [Acidomyces richmondensis BFW]
MQHFPSWRCEPETGLLSALLRDIGTTFWNPSSTSLSFEFAGSLTTLDQFKSLRAGYCAIRGCLRDDHPALGLR